MNLHAYFNQYPTAAIAAVASQAGTSLAYLQHCKYGTRRMSADLAIKLEPRRSCSSKSFLRFLQQT